MSRVQVSFPAPIKGSRYNLFPFLFPDFRKGEKTMTQKEILEIALAQSASDSNCAPKDFLSEKNKIVAFEMQIWFLFFVNREIVRYRF